MVKNLLIIFLFYSFTSVAQGWQPMGSRSMSLSNATVALEDVWAYHHNPAALSNLKKIEFGVSYENRFLLKELQSQGLVIAIPLKKGVISIGSQSFGYNQFRTYRNGLGYSMKLAEFLSVGVQLNHHFVRINSNYGNHQTVTAEVGALAKINDKWSVSEKVLFLAEAEKNIDYSIRFKTGIEYLPLDNFYVRGGFATAPIEFSFGLGYTFSGKYKLDLGSAYHQVLCWSPHFSFTMQLK